MKKILFLIFAAGILFAWSDPYLEKKYIPNDTAPTGIRQHQAGYYTIGKSTSDWQVKTSSNGIELTGGAIIVSTYIAVSSSSYSLTSSTADYSLNADKLDDRDYLYFAVYNDVKVATDTLRTDLTAETTNRIAADILLGETTGHLRTEVNNLHSSTATLTGQVSSLQSQITILDGRVDDLEASTGTYVSTTTLTSHTGDGTIHFTQSAISISSSQVSGLESVIVNESVYAQTAGTAAYADNAGLFNGNGTDYFATASDLSDTAASTGTIYSALQATYTYLNDYKLDESSATATYLTKSSATATYMNVNERNNYLISPATFTISGGGGGSGDMTKAVYDTDDNGVVDNVNKRYIYFSKVGTLSTGLDSVWGNDFQMLADTYTLTKVYARQGSTVTSATNLKIGSNLDTELLPVIIPAGAYSVEITTNITYNKWQIINYHIDLVATPDNEMEWNEGFEEADTGVAGSSWTEVGTAASIGRTTLQKHTGDYSCMFDDLTTTYAGRGLKYSTVTVVSDYHYEISAWFYVDTGFAQADIRIYAELYDAGDNLIGTVGYNPTGIKLSANATWEQISFSTVTASNVTQAIIIIDARETGAAGTDLYIDDCVVGRNLITVSNLAITCELDKQ